MGRVMIMHVVSPGWRFSNPGSVVKGKEIIAMGYFWCQRHGGQWKVLSGDFIEVIVGEGPCIH